MRLARLPAALPPTPIRDEHDCREPLASEREAVGGRQAGAMDDHLRVHRAEEEMVLVLLADAAWVREPEQIGSSSRGRVSAPAAERAGERRGESHEIVTG
jgi:hypothetical protein